MLHKEVALDATTTDAGEFTAIAATWSVDRQKEQIMKGAFEDTITAWKHQGRPIPVHWNHKGDAANVIGSVDPRSMAETDEGLRVEGQLDLQDSEVAREAWRSMKAGRIALSFGYIVTSDFKRDDGVRELLAIDLYEISLTPSPANPDTRITSMKSASRGSGLAGVLDDLYVGRTKAAYRESDFARSLRDYLRWPDDREVRQLMDREVEKLAAELEAKAARRAKAARPIKIKRFEV